MNSLATVILAAGKGTRMKSKTIKVLHKLAGKSMLQHLIDTVTKMSSEKTVTVIGYQGEKVKESIKGENLSYVYQHNQKGTGHAVLQAKDELTDFNGNTLVLYGDAPLLTRETLQKMVETHNESQASATILSTCLDDPTGYGRIVRDEDDNFLKIVEQSDLSSQAEEDINEINTGICVFDNQKLFEALDKVEPDNEQGEYYLTDVFSILLSEGAKVEVMITEDPEETIGINDRVRLAEAEQIIRRRINERVMRSGVTLINPATTFIDEDVEIGQDTIVHPFTHIEGKTVIGEDVVIGPHTRIQNAKIGDKVNITQSTILDSTIHEKVKVGPFAYIRPGNEIHAEAKIGDFVELKKSTIGKGSKVPHLSYVGDAQVGENCNIGAGTITANYDGENKHKTKLGNGVFIGSNSTLVAPVELKDGASTGAGSVVTKDVPNDTTVVGVPARKFNKK